MKPIIRRGLGLLLILSFLTAWAVLLGMSSKARRIKTCTGRQSIQVTVTDSMERRFVAKEDVERWLDTEYRAWAGLQLDSVDLYRIEKIISSHSAVKTCEAWLTDDGALHVRLSQRQPVVRFQDGGNGFYADESAFIFPLQARGSVAVPIVDGALPIKVERGFKGELTERAQKEWVEKIVTMAAFISSSPWKDIVSQIHVDDNGDLTIYPSTGKEKFIFGSPTRVEEKFGLMEKYYKSIVPAKGEGHYRSVDVRYKGQIVCKK